MSDNQHDMNFDMVTKPKRWGIGLQAGYGVSLHNGEVFPAPYIGVGLSYSIINW